MKEKAKQIQLLFIFIYFMLSIEIEKLCLSFAHHSASVDVASTKEIQLFLYHSHQSFPHQQKIKVNNFFVLWQT
jgi:hypothetical protein